MKLDMSSITKLLNIRALARYRGILTILVSIALIGFTAYQISQITSVQPDQAYLQSQKDTAGSVKLKATPAFVEKLRELKPATSNSVQVRSGKSNPFAL